MTADPYVQGVVQRVSRSTVSTNNTVSNSTVSQNSTISEGNSNSGSVSQSSASQSTPSPASMAPRRRSRSRRVVRGVGETTNTVVEHSPAEPADASNAANDARTVRIAALASEIFSDPGISAKSADASAAFDADSSDSHTTRGRRASLRFTKQSQSRHGAQNADAAQSAQTASDEQDGDTRVTRRTRRRSAERVALAPSADSSKRSVDQDNNDEEPSARARRARRAVSQILEFSNPEVAVSSRAHADSSARPMMSLLFQEPAARPASAFGEASDGGDTSRHHDENADELHTVRTRRRRRSASSEGNSASDIREDDSREDRSGRTDRDESDSEQSGSRRSRRSRRLNAQERRAAAEVEHIEEDLQYDDITYTPVEGETGRASDEESEARSRDDSAESGVVTRTRRRRRRHEDENDVEESAEAEEQTVTRRRRRRHAGKGEDEKDIIPRSRKQQYIDEITDIEGSTRLEAKKQRRRDNRRDRSRQALITEQDFLARRESVNRLMVVREKERHTQISVIEDNTLVEHYVSDIQEVSSVGNIYLGRVQNVLPSMEAAFVDIGQPRNGVLYAGEVNWDTTRLDGQPRRIELAFKSGDPVLVQVTKDPIGHKGARLTSQVTLAGRFLVLVPSGGMTGVSRKLPARERARLKSIVSKIAPKDMGVIIRTAAEGASEEAIVKDLEHLSRQWESISSKQKEYEHSRRPHLLQGEPDVAIRVVRDIFNDDFSKLVVEGDRVYERITQYLESTAPDLLDRLEKWDPAEHNGKDVFDKWSIDSQLRKGMERKVYLPSGGSLVIDRTEAMTTIDVNTGRFIGKGKSLEETVTRCNLEAAEEIVRQLRLRDIGGMIMIDFVDMVLPQNRDLVLRRLVECLSRDRTKHQVAEVTSLGLVQMTRKRVGQGLVEAFSEECPTCKGRGFILHDEPIVSASYDDPYALKGGDPFIKTNKHNHGTQVPEHEIQPSSTPAVKAKLAQIAAAAQAAGAASARRAD